MRFLVCLIFLSSCAFNRSFDKSSLRPVAQGIPHTIHVYPYTVLDKSNKPDTSSWLSGKTVLSLLGIKSFRDTASFVFSQKALQIRYTDTLGKSTDFTIKGKMKKDGFFYCKRVKRNILIPIFYSHRELTKYRFSFSNDDAFVVAMLDINERNIIFLGGGGTIERYFYYKMKQ